MRIDWNHSGVSELPYRRFHINLNSAYEWGRGWDKQEEKAFSDAFEPALKRFAEKYGVGYKDHENSTYLCPEVGDDGEFEMSYHFYGNNRPPQFPYAYVHPMDVAGYATPEQVQELKALFDERPDIAVVTRVIIDDEVMSNITLLDSYLELLRANVDVLKEAYESCRIDSWHTTKFESFIAKYAELKPLTPITLKGVVSFGTTDADYVFLEKLLTGTTWLEADTRPRVGAEERAWLTGIARKAA